MFQRPDLVRIDNLLPTTVYVSVFHDSSVARRPICNPRDCTLGTDEACSPAPTRLNEPKSPLAAADISFRTETKTVYVCTYGDCNKKYSRMPDLRRHYRGSHLEDRRFKCRALGCERAIRGFPRRDKRDTHEKKMHIDIGDGISL